MGGDRDTPARLFRFDTMAGASHASSSTIAWTRQVDEDSDADPTSRCIRLWHTGPQRLEMRPKTPRAISAILFFCTCAMHMKRGVTGLAIPPRISALPAFVEDP